MTKIDRYKILVRYLISIGVAASQQELGTKVGYNNASAFSQVINGKAVEPKNFMNKLKELSPNLNLEWLETGEGNMLIEENVNSQENTQENAGSGQQFNGPITGDNPQFAGNNLTNNPPCTFGVEIDKIVSAMTAQADLTKEAHELTRRAQAQVDVAQQQINRLLAIIEQKLNIVPV
ncbi:hypothetical protein D1638_01010 [Muribaculaceae bacterium Z1]|nr:hypothetical protein [Muribaculaceae bacterium S4]NBI19503.1 hypothetical protein [Muribaculaceae bacterium Z1]